MTQPPAASPSWFEHVDLMQAVIAATILVLAWFMIRTLKTIDSNQKELFERMHSLEKDFYVLQGEHKNNGERLYDRRLQDRLP